MKQKFVLDTNIIVRILTKDEIDLVEQAEQLIARVEKGEISFYIPSMVVAGTCWTLSSFYRFQRKDIGKMVKHFVQSEGVELEEPWIIGVLDDFIDHNVDFIDAYIAKKSQRNSLSVITWNKKHFKRLDCEFFTPEDLLDVQ